jgi:hypothetical protein
LMKIINHRKAPPLPYMHQEFLGEPNEKILP